MASREKNEQCTFQVNLTFIAKRLKTIHATVRGTRLQNLSLSLVAMLVPNDSCLPLLPLPVS